jgi:hypothetical protein
MLYSEQNQEQQSLRAYNAITGRRTTILTDRREITDVIIAQPDRLDQILVISLRDRVTGSPSATGNLSTPKLERSSTECWN